VGNLTKNYKMSNAHGSWADLLGGLGGVKPLLESL
jgi:hypothetical protein